MTVLAAPAIAAAPVADQDESARTRAKTPGDCVAGAISHPAPLVDDRTPSREVAAIFEAHPRYFALAIKRHSGGFGLIDRSALLTQFARRFGRDLFEKKPISALMNKHPLVVDASTPAAVVAKRFADDHDASLAAGFVITSEKRYVGVASGVDLLRLQADQLSLTLATLNEAQNDLVQAEKMASLGQLVAGVAHEINTPIGIGLTAASHLREATDKFDQLFVSQKLKRSDLEYYVGVATESADMIQANIDRAAHLIQSFKQVAVDQTSGDRRRFSMAGLLEDLLASLRPELKHSPHRVVIDCPPDIVLDSYPGALTQVFTNFILNALIHAFEPSRPGTLSIVVRALGAKAVISVSDDGKGIPEENLPKIFDPFFTTRRGQGGSGLGLHIVYNSVTTTLRGRLTCQSKPGEGAAFTIRLPMSVSDGSPT